MRPCFPVLELFHSIRDAHTRAMSLSLLLPAWSAMSSRGWLMLQNPERSSDSRRVSRSGIEIWGRSVLIRWRTRRERSGRISRRTRRELGGCRDGRGITRRPTRRGYGHGSLSYRSGSVRDVPLRIGRFRPFTLPVWALPFDRFLPIAFLCPIVLSRYIVVPVLGYQDPGVPDLADLARSGSHTLGEAFEEYMIGLTDRSRQP